MLFNKLFNTTAVVVTAVAGFLYIDMELGGIKNIIEFVNECSKRNKKEVKNEKEY